MGDDVWNLDRIGRHVAQLLADDNDDMHVSTYGVLADVVHVTCPDGSRFHIELTPEDDDAEA